MNMQVNMCTLVDKGRIPVSFIVFIVASIKLSFRHDDCWPEEAWDIVRVIDPLTLGRVPFLFQMTFDLDLKAYQV